VWVEFLSNMACCTNTQKHQKIVPQKKKKEQLSLGRMVLGVYQEMKPPKNIKWLFSILLLFGLSFNEIVSKQLSCWFVSIVLWSDVWAVKYLNFGAVIFALSCCK